MATKKSLEVFFARGNHNYAPMIVNELLESFVQKDKLPDDVFKALQLTHVGTTNGTHDTHQALDGHTEQG